MFVSYVLAFGGIKLFQLAGLELDSRIPVSAPGVSYWKLTGLLVILSESVDSFTAFYSPMFRSRDALRNRQLSEQEDRRPHGVGVDANRGAADVPEAVYGRIQVDLRAGELITVTRQDSYGGKKALVLCCVHGPRPECWEARTASSAANMSSSACLLALLPHHALPPLRNVFIFLSKKKYRRKTKILGNVF